MTVKGNFGNQIYVKLWERYNSKVITYEDRVFGVVEKLENFEILSYKNCKSTSTEKNYFDMKDVKEIKLIESPTIMGAFKLESLLKLERFRITQDLEKNPILFLDKVPSEIFRDIKICSSCVPIS